MRGWAGAIAAIVFCLVCYALGFGAPVARIEFEDRSAASGIHAVLQNAATPEKHLIETMAGGVAVFDFDNDGLPDVYLVNGAEQPSLRKTSAAYYNRLYHNDGHFRFSDVTEKAHVQGRGFGMGAAAGDYDNDGWTDLLVTGVEGVTLYRNNGDGTFTDVTEAAHLRSSGWSVGAAWLDFDNDGKLDLFIVRYVQWDPAKEPYCGEASPKVRTYCHPRFYQPTTDQLFRNNGDGTFTDVSESSGIAAHPGKGMAAAIGDYDNDGRIDIFVSNDTMPNFLFHNEGGGRFAEAGLRAGVALNDDGVAISSMGSEFRDLDNDGREEIVVSALMHETFPLFHNVAAGLFVDHSYKSGLARGTAGFSGWGVGAFDFNNDGWKDLLIANGDVQNNTEAYSGRPSRQQNVILLNDAKGGFQTYPWGAPALHRGAAFADFDRDGRMDAIVTRLNERPLVARNVSADTGHWLEIALRGRRSNRLGIGARVTVTAGSTVRVNRCTTAGSYASSSEAVVHFGLGSATAVDRVEVEWPSGVRQVLEKQKADRLLTIEEAEGGRELRPRSDLWW